MYHRCRYRDTEKQRPSSEKHKAATKLCRVALWETKEGGDWLRLLVFAVIYCFGIKKHRLRKSISIFRLLHLEERIGCSASALRELEVQLKEQIIAYGRSKQRQVMASNR